MTATRLRIGVIILLVGVDLFHFYFEREQRKLITEYRQHMLKSLAIANACIGIQERASR